VTISSGNKPKTHHLSITYKPKIPGIISGDIRCDIRIGRKGRFKVGELVEFHGWQERPYWSPWSWRTKPYKLIAVEEIWIQPNKVRFWQEAVPEDGTPEQWIGFSWDGLDRLAERDGIVPPTGIELRKVLTVTSGLDPRGDCGQILEW
jgi:hypothetical protein